MLDSRALKLRLFVAMLVHGSAFAQPITPAQPGHAQTEPMGSLTLPPVSEPSAAMTISSRWRGNRLGKAIASTATQSMAQAGVEVAKQAVLDCQKGDYPGGGMGLLSLPFGRAHSRTDHCFR